MLCRVNIVCFIALAFAVFSAFADDDHGADAVSYDKETFESAVPSKDHFVMFFAPWCGHCKRLAPTWNELAKVFNSDTSTVKVAKVDCTSETALCSDHEVSGYPTLKFFKKGGEVQRYKGGRELEALQKFVEEQTGKAAEEVVGSEEPAGAGAQELTDDSFTSTIQKNFHFVKFYAPWCGHCKNLAPTWDELAQAYSKDAKVAVEKVDCTVSTKTCTDFGVRGYPTLILFNNGDKVDQYQGARTLDDLKAFVKKNVESVGEEKFGGQQETVPEKTEAAAEGDVKDLTDDNFEDVVGDGLTFVKFFAPWCGHCKRLAPTWEELGTANKDKAVTIAKVDCTQHKAACDGQSVRGYPTLIIFQNGIKLADYNGGRTLEDLQSFVDKHLAHIEL